MGDAYVASLRALDPTKFKEYLVGHTADLAAVRAESQRKKVEC